MSTLHGLFIIAVTVTLGLRLARSARVLLEGAALSPRWTHRWQRSVRLSRLALLLGAPPPFVLILTNPAVSGWDDPLLWVYIGVICAGVGVALVGFVVLFGLSLWLSIRAGALISLGAAFVAGVQWTLDTWQQSGHHSGTRSHDLLWPDYSEEPPSAFSDYLGREQFALDGRDETKLDPFGFDTGPHRTGLSHASLDDIEGMDD